MTAHDPAENPHVHEASHALHAGEVERAVHALLLAVTVQSVEIARLKERCHHQSEPERGVRD